MKPKTKTLLFIAVAFLLGGVAGVFANRYWGIGPRVGHQRMTPADYRSRFHSSLSLDSTQIRGVDSLLDVFGGQMDSQRQLMQGYRDTLRAGIRSLLTEEQKKKYEEHSRAMGYRDGGGRRDTTR